MNTRENSNRSNVVIHIVIAIIVVASFVPAAMAGQSREYNPYTVLGMQIRSQLLPETPGAEGVDLGPLVFQEIVPCRFVSTLEADEYEDPWGPEAFQMHESRVYFPKGELVAANGWTNPCSRQVPLEALAVSLRLMSHGPIQSGNVFLAPAFDTPVKPALIFAGGTDAMKEANVVLKQNGFSLGVDQPTHLTIDIIGYFLRDDRAYGAKGDRGDRGEKGETGSQGIQGERGEKGEQGDRGESGAQGIDGDRGEKGEQGERGETGAQGIQGDRGEKGEQGDRGETGAQGIQGERGDKGEQGDRGEQGLQGLQGQRGEQGDRGEAGARGENGAQGPQGPLGPKGDKGAKGDKGDVGVLASMGGPYVFPPGGTLTIVDPVVTPNSFIILSYIEYSNGNALGIASQSNGSFVATGSPNKPFQYVVLTIQ